MSPSGTPLPPSSAVASAFMPNAYDPYTFDDDNFGSGALYPGGSMGLRNKRSEADRECKP